MGNQIDTLGSIFSKDNFVGAGADKVTYGLAGVRDFSVDLGSESVKRAAGAGGIFFIIVGYRFDDRRRF